ncbi:MAG: hypothetical protein ACFE9T_10545 [Promethearchaeota archaeon]
MLKKYYILSLFLISSLIFNSIIGFSIASDDDDDGIDDDFEEENKRNIEIEFEEDKIEIVSILRNGDAIDEIEFVLKNDTDGFHVEVSYESEYDSESESEIETELELEFGIVFRKIIEYVDLDSDGIYNESVDQTIQEFTLDSFQKTIYIESNISSDCTSHCFIINTTNGIFTAIVHITEEFDLINETLITPTEAKIDIELNNFNYTDDNSQLALYVRLTSEIDYEEEDDTPDEKKHYAINERGVSINNQTFLGFFTWNENATIDGITNEVKVSAIQVDDDENQEQKIYINYQRGAHIYHDPKIGITEIVKSKWRPFFPIIIIIGSILLIGIAIAISYTAHHFISSRNIVPLLDVDKRGTSKKFSSSLLQVFDEKGALKKMAKFGDVPLTALSEDFLKALEKFNWELDEKEEFIKEMLALTPKEREEIIREMLEKSKL